MGHITLEDARTEKMGADMLTKLVGSGVIKVNIDHRNRLLCLMGRRRHL